MVGIEIYPAMVRKFHICRTALGSSVTSLQTSVYDLDAKKIGRFDLVLFYGVLNHLRHPLLALEKIAGVCAGTRLLQSAVSEDRASAARAEFHPFGVASGSDDFSHVHPTVLALESGVRSMPCFSTSGFGR